MIIISRLILEVNQIDKILTDILFFDKCLHSSHGSHNGPDYWKQNVALNNNDK